jgi:hypothetical protein
MGMMPLRPAMLSMDAASVHSARSQTADHPQEAGDARRERRILLAGVIQGNIVLERKGAALLRRIKALLKRIASLEMRLRKRKAAPPRPSPRSKIPPSLPLRK